MIRWIKKKYSIALLLSLCAGLGLWGCQGGVVEKLPTSPAEEATIQPTTENDTASTLGLGAAGTTDVEIPSGDESGLPVTGTVEETLGLVVPAPTEVLTEPAIAETEAGPEVLKRFYNGETVDRLVAQKNNATIMSGIAGVFDLTDPYWWMQYQETWNKEALVNVIDQYKLPQGTCYLDGQELTEDMRMELQKLRAMNSIQAEPIISYGIVWTNTAVKMFPTQKRLTYGPTNKYCSTDPDTFDRLRESTLFAGEGVLILNTSTDGDFLFVQAENDCGWVSRKDIIPCDYDTMCQWLTALDFVVVISYDASATWAGQERELRMGSRLLFYDKTDSSLILLLPCPLDYAPNYALTSRSGSLQLIKAEDLLPGDLPVKSVVKDRFDFSEGYLTFNDENVKEQAKKLLGVPYGWGDEEGMDCSSTVNAIYRSFGFKLPRNTADMMKICGGNSNVVDDISDYSSEDRRAAIVAGQVGSILLMKGHVMIYMGQVDGVPMILHNVVAYMDPTNTVYCPIGSCVMTPLDIVSKDVHYYELIQYIISLYE